MAPGGEKVYIKFFPRFLSFSPRKSPENQVWKKHYFRLFEPIFDGITNLAKLRTFVFL